MRPREYLKKVGILESIKGRLVLYFILLLVVPFLFIGYIAYNSEKAALQDRIKGHLTSIADIQKGRIRTWLYERVTDVSIIAGNGHIIQDIETLEKMGDPHRYVNDPRYLRILDQLNSVKKSHNYLDIFILDEDGRITATTVNKELGEYRLDTEYYKESIKAGLAGQYIQGVYYDTHYGKLAMAFVAPMHSYPNLRDYGGAAVLVVGMDESFTPIIEDRPGMGSTGDTLIGKREGGYVVYLNRLKYRPDSPLTFKFPLSKAPTPILNATGDIEGMVEAKDYRGVKVLAATRYIPETGWGLVVKEDYDEIFAPVESLGRKVLYITGFALLMVFILIYMVSSRIADPIVELSALTRRVTGGDFGVNLPVKRKDEVGVLAGSFNDMATALMKYKAEVDEKGAEIGQANRELMSLARNLEAKVAERTAELEESRNRLRESLEVLERANVELRRMDRIKDNFLGMMSHELRTPLSLITGYSSNLLADRGFHLDARVEEAVEGIYKGSQRLKVIVNEMLDVSQIDARGLRLVFTPTNMLLLIEDVLKELGSFIRERGQTVVMGEFMDMPEVALDKKRMRQVVNNIIGNAVKFTPDGGRIEITARLYLAGDEYARAHGAAVGEYMEVVVKDSGIGIDKEEADRIFEKFYEVGDIEKHTTSKYRFLGRGVGLGLPIARGIVEAHGGRLWVESSGYDPARCPGSAFHVMLPIFKTAGDRGTVDRFGESVESPK